jgi:hypothetical protein
MALIFRWYLGMSSNWAVEGTPDRRVDYQVWTGPGMGAFNEWAKDSFLMDFRKRNVAHTALNILHGAAVINRVNHLKNLGVNVPSETADIKPRVLIKS